METEGSLQHSKEPASCPYPEPYQSSPCSPPIPRLIKIGMWPQMLVEIPNMKFHENPSGRRYPDACGQMDRHDDVNSRFSLAKAPKHERNFWKVFYFRRLRVGQDHVWVWHVVT
jgi:hypothetical protein